MTPEESEKLKSFMQYPNAFQNQQQSESTMKVSWLWKTIVEKDNGQQGLRNKNYHMCVLVITHYVTENVTIRLHFFPPSC